MLTDDLGLSSLLNAEKRLLQPNSNLDSMIDNFAPLTEDYIYTTIYTVIVTAENQNVSSRLSDLNKQLISNFLPSKNNLTRTFC